MTTPSPALQQAQAVMAAAGAVAFDPASADDALYRKIAQRAKVLAESPEYLALCQRLADKRVTFDEARTQRREIAQRLQAAGAFG